MRFRDRMSAAWQALTGRSGAPSAYGTGPMVMGGPYHQDAFSSKRAPTPYEIIELYKSLIFFCTNLNADRTTAVPQRLYAMSGSGMPKPRSACQPRSLTRAEEKRLKWLPGLMRSVAGAEDIHEITHHPFLELLDDPVPEDESDFDRDQLINLLCRYIDVVGTAYAKPVAYGEFPSEFWPLQSQYILPLRRLNTAIITDYNYFAETYKAADLFRVRLRPSLHDPYGAGYSAAQAAVQYAGLEDEWVSIQKSLLGAGPRFGMVISAADAKMPIGKDEGEKLEREMNAKFSRGGANRVWVNKTGLNVQTTTYPPSDLAGLEISRYNLERIANCFGVPPAYLSDSANLANTQAAKELHATNAVEPRANCIGAALSRFVRRYSGDRRLFVAPDPVVAEDEERKTKVVDMKLKNGSLVINEARADDGLPPVEWGDEPWLPQTLIQPTAAAEAREAAQAAADKAAEQPKPDPAGDPAADDESSRALRDRLGRALDLIEEEIAA
jgi:phage portal protein BeeE